MTICTVCNDTGKLPGSDYPDCVHCGVAIERTALNEYVECNKDIDLERFAWCIHQRARQIERQEQAARIAELERQLAEASAPAVEQRNIHAPLLIARIKRYRDAFGCTLAEAKDACEHGRDLNSYQTAFITPPASIGSISDCKEFREDLLRLSESGLSRKQAGVIRNAIYKAIDARVALASSAAPQAADTDKVRKAESLLVGGLATVQAWKALQDAAKACRKVETGASIDNDKSPSDFKAGIVKGATDCIYAIGLIDAAKFGNEASSMAAQAPVREVPEGREIFGWIIVNEDTREHDGGEPFTDKTEADECIEYRFLPGWELEPIYRLLPAAPVQQEGEKP